MSAPADPSPALRPATFENFDEAAYLAANPDVAQAVAKGEWPSGWQHFKAHGHRENRRMADASPPDHPDLRAAAATWDDPEESLESVNARIHDGVALDQLDARADAYVARMFGMFPELELPRNPVCLEIGSGTGYIMEALDRELNRRRQPASAIVGLDIARHMLDKAQTRIGGRKPFRFLHYDGVHVPLPDGSIDLVYSVAALQHIPKPYVYNLFLETFRLLRNGRNAVFHLLSFKQLPQHIAVFPWREDIASQIEGRKSHWHHFYSREEVEYVLKIGTQFERLDIREEEGSLWALAGKPG